MKYGYHTERNSKGEEITVANTPRKVTKEQLYAVIWEKKLDVIGSCIGNHPYKYVFKFRDGETLGWIEPDDKTSYMYDI